MHISIFLLSVGVMITSYMENLIHIQLSGLCGLSTSIRQNSFMKTGFISILLLLFYITISLIALKQFRKFVPSIEEIKHVRKQYLFIYQRFVLVTTLLWSIGVALSVLSNLNCYMIHNALLNITITVFNLINILTPIVSLILYLDTKLHKGIRSHR